MLLGSGGMRYLQPLVSKWAPVCQIWLWVQHLCKGAMFRCTQGGELVRLGAPGLKGEFLPCKVGD